MSSLKEYAECLPCIEVQATEEFLVKLKLGDIEIANVIISIEQLIYNTERAVEIGIRSRLVI